jgi:hypothetical protein
MPERVGGSGGARLAVEELSVLGVRLDQYAGVTAALAEGVALREVLAQERIDEEAWPAADRAWKEAFVEAPDLLLRYMQLRRKAEDCLSRRIEPLEDDPAAWAGLLGALALDRDPDRVLQSLGLRMSDVGRLGRLWRDKVESDPALVERLTNLAGNAKPPKVVRCGPAVLRPFPWTPRPGSSAQPAEAAAITSLAEPLEAAPPAVAVPSYLREQSPSWVRSPAPLPSETLGPVPGPPAAALPFGDQPSAAFLEELVAGPQAAPAQSGETLSLGPDAVKASAVLPFEVQAPRAELGETLPLGPGAPKKPALPFQPLGKPDDPFGLSLEQYAALWAELAVFPDRSASILPRYGLPDDDARKKLNEAWGRRFVKEPALRRTWMELCARHRASLQAQER